MPITLAWDSRFEIGHERIDSEHRIFLSLVRDLSVESENGAKKERVERTLHEIYKYADFHFTSEENIMADVDYPQLAAHKQEHKMLLAQLKNFIQRYRADLQRPEDVVDFLFQWFAMHTTQEDKLIAKFIVRLEQSALFSGVIKH